MSLKKSWIAWGVVMVVAVVVAACAPRTVTVERTVEVPVERTVEVLVTPTPGGPSGTLVRAITTDPNSLDLPQCAERQASTTAWQMYDSLVWLDDEGNIAPALAESWEVSEDGTEYIFHLRRGVTFHNGEPFNADAVVFSWQRASTGDYTYSNYWQRASSVEKIDDYTVRVTTEEPDALFLRLVADNWAIIPPGYYNEVGEQGFVEHPIGTGPFMLVEWVKGDHITMRANPNYWREGAPRIAEVVFRSIPESATRVAAIQTGEIDIATRLTAEEAKSLLGAPNVQIIRYIKDRVYYIAFNNLTTGVGTPIEDRRVRLAMNYAVDVDAIIDAIFEGYAVPATGFVTPANLGYDETLQPFGYDPDRARQLLAEAGYPDGFSIDMACPAGAYEHFEEVCEAIAGYLGDVGIEVNLEIMESGHYWDLEANKELPPLFGDSWSSAVGEAYPRLEGALKGWDATYSSWWDPEIGRMIDQIKVTVDDEERAEIYRQLQRYMQEDPPFIYLYIPYTFEAINTRVQDYHPRPAETYFLYYTWLLED